MNFNKKAALAAAAFAALLFSCKKSFLELEPHGTQLESGFYKNADQVFEGLVAVYDVLQWNGSNGWTMKLGLLDAASDDCYAGGSSADDQPAWVAMDNFKLDPNLGPQLGLWQKGFSGVYRANLLLEKLGNPQIDGLTDAVRARYVAETKFLRAFYYFDLVRFFGNVPLMTRTVGGAEIYQQVQATPAEVFAQIEKDLKEAVDEPELPLFVIPSEAGRVTKGAARALLARVLLFENDPSRMAEAASQCEEVINSGFYQLENFYSDVFRPDNKFGPESVFEIAHSNLSRGGYESFSNGTEGNYNVQFFGMRDYVGPTYANGWSFCPVTEDLVNFMKGDPRFQHTVIDGKALLQGGASYTKGYQNTDYFIKKYTPLPGFKATSGDVALNWPYNIKEIRLADVLLMAAEALARSGNEPQAKVYLNRVRKRVGLPDRTSTGQALLDDIATERRLELATEGHRFWDLLRTGKAVAALGSQGFVAGKSEWLPIPQSEIDITQGKFKQNPNY